MATGAGFHGRKVLAGPVVYLAGEGHNGLMRRIEAWSKEQKVDVKQCPLFLSQSAAQFLNDVLIREVADACCTTQEQGTIGNLKTGLQMTTRVYQRIRECYTIMYDAPSPPPFQA